MQPWAWLAIAIVLEVAGTVSLKVSNGFSKLIPSLLVVMFYSASFSCLAISLKKMEVGIAYSIWSGVGTALIAIIGILYFGESLSTLKVLSILLVIAGVVGLNLVGNTH